MTQAALQSTENRFPQNLPSGWREALQSESEKPYFKNLSQFLKSEYEKGRSIYPGRENILRALQVVDLPNVRVVILGQDPYHGPDQAIGLSFAVPNALRPKPPSLLNIFKEIQDDCGKTVDFQKSELANWTKQGVLLLNSVLTVRAGQAFSHRDKGWEQFTDAIIKKLNERANPIVFLLWGSAAHKKSELLDSSRHFILKSAHPSPLSAHRGFLGSKHFSQANDLLVKLGNKPIEWWITN